MAEIRIRHYFICQNCVGQKINEENAALIITATISNTSNITFQSVVKYYQDVVSFHHCPLCMCVDMCVDMRRYFVDMCNILTRNFLINEKASFYETFEIPNENSAAPDLRWTLEPRLMMFRSVAGEKDVGSQIAIVLLGFIRLTLLILCLCLGLS